MPVCTNHHGPDFDRNLKGEHKINKIRINSNKDGDDADK